MVAMGAIVVMVAIVIGRVPNNSVENQKTKSTFMLTKHIYDIDWSRHWYFMVSADYVPNVPKVPNVPNVLMALKHNCYCNNDFCRMYRA
jgi:hypothetical protein